MSEDEATKLLNYLLQQDATQVQAWLKSIWTGQQQIPEEFNWQGLAYIAADKARGDSTSTSDSPSLEWAKVAISVYDLLAKKYSESSGFDSFIRSSMMLRAYLILKLGATPGDLVLDPNLIVNWFFDNLKISFKEAWTIASDWRTLSRDKFKELMQNKQQIEKLRELREIKNRLGAIKLLSQSKQFTLDEEISNWLSLQEKLP
ncbi:MAG: hypothetical protein KME08_20850 [Aphanothece sp. CMT-3BRIN-NPC111]|jgi:hypothetical protein|nr:hypothetical protein [Aphanothece sp. CMT-3BRIN-NPC111]